VGRSVAEVVLVGAVVGAVVGTDAGGSGAGDGFPEEDVAPDETDPEMDVTDPFAVGEDREPLEPGSD